MVAVYSNFEVFQSSAKECADSLTRAQPGVTSSETMPKLMEATVGASTGTPTSRNRNVIVGESVDEDTVELLFKLLPHPDERH